MSKHPAKLWRAIGAISGTSMDGIDVALIETDGADIARPGPGGTTEYAPELRRSLMAAAADPEHIAGGIAALESRVTRAHVLAIQRFMATHRLTPADVEVVGLHGQTILHQPEHRVTLQLGRGAEAAGRLAIDTVDGFRLADVAAGGQGAPLVPLYHHALLGAAAGPTMVLNLGGVGNVTYLDTETVLAFDTGPASALLDDFMMARRGVAFDAHGALAASGRASAALVADFMTHPFFSARPPKSLDRQAFHRWIASIAELSDADGAATLAAFTVASVRASLAHVPRTPRRWLVTGGGRRNTHFMVELRRALQTPVESVESEGLDGDFLEAQAFGYLAVRAARGLPLSLPTTTGVPRPMPGGRLHRAPGAARPEKNPATGE